MMSFKEFLEKEKIVTGTEEGAVISVRALGEYQEALGYFYGLGIGDGSIDEKRYVFDLATSDKLFISKIREMMEKAYLPYKIDKPKRKLQKPHWNHDITRFRIGNKYMAHKIASIRERPFQIMFEPIEIQKGFVEGWFDSDGCIGIGKVHKNFYLTITKSPKEKILMLSELLRHSFSISLRFAPKEKTFRIYSAKFDTLIQFCNNFPNSFKVKRFLGEAEVKKRLSSARGFANAKEAIK